MTSPSPLDTGGATWQGLSSATIDQAPRQGARAHRFASEMRAASRCCRSCAAPARRSASRLLLDHHFNRQRVSIAAALCYGSRGGGARLAVHRRRLDGEQEAHLVALACSAPPEGHKRWTLRLLARRLVELELVESVSYQTVRQALKQTASSRG